MFAKFVLPALALTLATTSCATTSATSRRLPKICAPVLAEDSTVVQQPAENNSQQRNSRSHVFIKLGRMSLDDRAFWTDVNRPASFGIEADFREADSAIGPEFGFAFGRDGDVFLNFGTDQSNSTFIEIYGGVRITGDFLPRKRLHPYIGVGATVILAELERVVGLISTADDNATLGGYAHAGFYYDLNRVISVGVDGRTVFGTELDMFGGKTDADYEQLSFILGIGF